MVSASGPPTTVANDVLNIKNLTGGALISVLIFAYTSGITILIASAGVGGSRANCALEEDDFKLDAVGISSATIGALKNNGLTTAL